MSFRVKPLGIWKFHPLITQCITDREILQIKRRWFCRNSTINVRNLPRYLHPCRYSLSVIMSVAAMYGNDYKESNKNNPQIHLLRVCGGHFRFTLIAGFHFSYSFFALKTVQKFTTLKVFCCRTLSQHYNYILQPHSLGLLFVCWWNAHELDWNMDNFF